MSDSLKFRFLQATASDFKEARGRKTLRVCFSSEAPVLRVGNGNTNAAGAKFYEVLSHDPEHADLSLLQGSGAFLDEHDSAAQIGSVRRAWLDGDRKGRAILVFGDTDLARERYSLMSGGHRRDISFGYELTKLVGESRHADGLPIKRFAWRAHEISSVAVGADHFVAGVGRSNAPITINHQSKMQTTTSGELNDLKNGYIENFEHCSHEIAQEHARLIADDIDVPTYKRAMRDFICKLPRKPYATTPALNHEIGMGARDLKQFSLARAIRSFCENKGRIDGFEGDCSRQVEIQTKSTPEGFFVPVDVILGGSARNLAQRSFATRDMFVGDFAQGGALVPTQIFQPIVEVLRNRMICQRLGCTSISGLSGDVAIPRQKKPATAESLGEKDELGDSNAEFEQLPAAPHRVGTSTTYTKQLVFQSAPDVEDFIRRDCATVVGLRHDYLLLNGSGADSEPTGILQSSAVGKTTFGGAVSYQQLVDMETALGLANADEGRLAYATTPATKGKLKGRAIVLEGATTVASIPIWQKGTWGDGSNDGEVNGYRAASTNQIPGNRVIFANWMDLVYCQWGGWDVVVDPYSLAKKAQIITTINTWIDSVIRHPQSFNVSEDAGNQ